MGVILHNQKMKTINTEYRNRILDLINKLKFATPERVRLEFMKKFKYISWITIKRHLELLTKEKLIEKVVLSKGKKRSICIYKSK